MDIGYGCVEQQWGGFCSVSPNEFMAGPQCASSNLVRYDAEILAHPNELFLATTHGRIVKIEGWF